MQTPDGVQIVAYEILVANAHIFPRPTRGPSAEVREKGMKARLDRAKAAYAPIIEPARSLRSRGATFQAIADILNGEGHSTRRGSPWDASGIRRVLNLFAD